MEEITLKGQACICFVSWYSIECACLYFFIFGGRDSIEIEKFLGFFSTFSETLQYTWMQNETYRLLRWMLLEKGTQWLGKEKWPVWDCSLPFGKTMPPTPSLNTGFMFPVIDLPHSNEIWVIKLHDLHQRLWINLLLLQSYTHTGGNGTHKVITNSDIHSILPLVFLSSGKKPAALIREEHCWLSSPKISPRFTEQKMERKLFTSSMVSEPVWMQPFKLKTPCMFTAREE